ncbi:hypothetical protein [Haliscomenobacter sp.]|uniref:hypothetical protein n=1 Tax=Haliscomenobacter sp. TaxID=2717303 RepID=UPI003364DA06
MTILYDIETDGLFLKGIEEGIEKGIKQGIELEKQVFVYKHSSLQEFSLEKIALIVDISPERLLEMLLAYLQTEGQTKAEAIRTVEAHQARFV